MGRGSDRWGWGRLPVLDSGCLLVSVDPALHPPLCHSPVQRAHPVLPGPGLCKGLWSSGEMVGCRNRAPRGPGLLPTETSEQSKDSGGLAQRTREHWEGTSPGRRAMSPVSPPQKGAALIHWDEGFSCQAVCWVPRPLQDMVRGVHFPNGGACQQGRQRAETQRSKPTRSLPTGTAVLQGTCRVATPEVSTGQSAAGPTANTGQ